MYWQRKMLWERPSDPLVTRSSISFSNYTPVTASCTGHVYRLLLRTLNSPLEHRQTPTRVAFFTTPAGVRVRSVAGGRTYSAAATVDGRVFKWGLTRPARPLRGNMHSRDGEGVEGRGNDPSERNGEAAVEASVPRQVAGVGMEASGC